MGQREWQTTGQPWMGNNEFLATGWGRLAVSSEVWQDRAHMGDRADPDNEHDSSELAEEFAKAAGEEGWKRSTLIAFCQRRGISASERTQLWPGGIRTVARKWSAMADGKTKTRAERVGLQPLSVVIAERFSQNEGLKRSVAKLARSDLVHPIDTLARTRTTVELMWLCQDRAVPSARLARVWWLVILYSICVLIWLATGPPYKGLQRAIRISAALAGAR